jgi:hypothetical protein
LEARRKSSDEYRKVRVAPISALFFWMALSIKAEHISKYDEQKPTCL